MADYAIRDTYVPILKLASRRRSNACIAPPMKMYKIALVTTSIATIEMPMQLKALDIPDIKIVNLRRFEDRRGFFSETYNRDALQLHGIRADFIQDNLSLSIEPGTVRGLHFQRPPQAQAKLIMVLTGRVLDVAVDCRKGSPTFGKHVSVELSASAWNQMFVPRGFAHGFCTLEPGTTVSYKVDAPYTPDLDGGVIWNDPDLGIQWPVNAESAILSDKDRQLPRFRDVGDVFDMGER